MAIGIAILAIVIIGLFFDISVEDFAEGVDRKNHLID